MVELATRREIPFDVTAEDWGILVAQIRGVTPLLMHNPRNLMRSETAAATRKQVPTPEQEAEAGLCRAALAGEDRP